MQLIRMNWDKDKYDNYEYGSGTYIKYGTKLYISSEKIMYKEKRITDSNGMLTTITL